MSEPIEDKEKLSRILTIGEGKQVEFFKKDNAKRSRLSNVSKHGSHLVSLFWWYNQSELRICKLKTHSTK